MGLLDVRRHMFGLAALVLLVPAVAWSTASAAEGPGFRNKRPPVIDLASVHVDAQRRLVVTYTAPDGVLYGGHVYMGNNPANATPAGGDPAYGQFMWCNNNSSCQGRWPLEEYGTAATGPFTFTSPVLDVATFPAGKWYVQVETTNEDQFASTRQWENSNIVTVELSAAKPGTGDGGAAGTDAKARFKQVVVKVSDPANGPPELRVNVTCPDARRFSVHTELTTPSGKRFFGGVVAHGDLDDGIGSKLFRWKSGALPDGFILRVWNVACWTDDAANAVGPGRRVFSTRCSDVDARNPCEVRYKE